MDKNDLCVSKVPLFNDLEFDKLKKINKLVKHRKYSKDEMIFMEGQPAQNIHIINSGRVKIFTTSSEGKEYIIRLLEEGDFFGELILFKEETVSYSAKAITEVSSCLINKNDLESLIQETPAISQEFLTVLSSRLKNIEDKAHSLALDDSKKKTIKLLNNLASETGTQKKDGILIELPLTREGLANLMGMSQETLSRKLSELEKQDKLKLLSGRKVLIKKDLVI
jgi:CRP/FNR family transcriptional regulator